MLKKIWMFEKIIYFSLRMSQFVSIVQHHKTFQETFFVYLKHPLYNGYFSYKRGKILHLPFKSEKNLTLIHKHKVTPILKE
jgi:hypothetical protein